jgi:hypothetical protein
MLRLRASLVVLAPLVFLAGSPRALATSIEALDLRTLVGDADHVVVGTVVGIEARYDHLDRIVTDATIRVEERMLGETAVGGEVTVRSLGGAIGEVGLRIEGEPIFVAGERVLVFARLHRGERVLRAVGMSQGVMPIRDVGGAEMALPGGEGLALLARGSDGRLRAAPAALIEPEPLDSVLARVRELVAELHAGR